ncbi:MAG: DUF4433 domain-containing protein [Flavobacteriia bacterium]|nr:DUF4433 domain-containing protein [Flavobacteriia bacterium]
MVHIENVQHILSNGLTLANSKSANKNYIPIGDNSLIDRRGTVTVPNGKNLNEFLPFYFWYRMPMLYVVQKGYNGVTVQNPENIVYCITNIEKIIQSRLPFLFTNGHAVSKLSKFFGKNEVNLLDEIIDFDAIKKTFWNDEEDLDLKRRKEAEFLVEGDIPLDVISGWVVYKEKAKGRLLNFGIQDKLIAVRENFYF